MDSHVDSKPVSLIARVVALWTNKRFLSAVNSHVGFQIGKFGTRVAALIAIVIFLCIRLDLVDFGRLGKFWFIICVFSVCWRLQSIGITEKNKARAISWSGTLQWWQLWWWWWWWPEYLPTERIPIGIRSVGILGVCQAIDIDDHDSDDDVDGYVKTL